MADRSLPDLPYAAVVDAADILHVNQDGIDKQTPAQVLARYIMRSSVFAREAIDVHTAYTLVLGEPKDVDITANASAGNYTVTLPAATQALSPTRVTISRKGVAAGVITVALPGHASVVLSAEEDFVIASCQKTGTATYSWVVLSRTQTPAENLAKWRASDPFSPHIVEAKTIPGSDDSVLSVRNTQAGKPHSILEVMAPAGATAESTLSLHAVASDVDWVFDYSLHNYSGAMGGVFVLSVFNADTKAPVQWVLKRRPTGATGYGTTQEFYAMKLTEDGGLLVNTGGELGPTPTFSRVLSEANRADFATAAQGTKADNAQPAASAITTSNIGSQHVSLADNASTLELKSAAAFMQVADHFGTAVGDVVIPGFESQGIYTTNSLTYVASGCKLYAPIAGTIRVYHKLSSNWAYPGYWKGYSKIYVGGVALDATEHVLAAIGPTTYYSDITVAAGALIEIWIKNDNASGLTTLQTVALCRNCRGRGY